MSQTLPLAPRNPSGHAPPRRPGSIRRTSSIDMTWPRGRGQELQVEGRGRDIFTPTAGDAPTVLAQDLMLATMATNRTIGSIASEPMRAGIEQLVGARGGGYLRQALNDSLPAEREAGSPLYMLIDDLSGASLISGWAWTRWQGPGILQVNQLTTEELKSRADMVVTMEGVCIGFRPGSSALSDLHGTIQNNYPVVPLPNPEDLAGWHDMPQHSGPAMRRARRIDVWQDGLVHIDAMFQDSATTPDGGRCAVHEYTFQATVDPINMTLLSVQAQPRILPYRECPAAIENIGLLVGTPMRNLRMAVLEQLRRVLGCTHLNDALRSLTEVPVLVQQLQKLSSAA